ncbi:MAG: penicillin acylase family protein, partial [Rhodothermales bacterium]
PPVGTLLDPLNGLYRTARIAEHPASQTHRIDALQDPVAIVRDDRGVPHIFAESDQDAIIALGYVVAQDRLFQLDFIPRVASGRLSEVFGPASLNTDRFLRQTGMEWGARKYVAGLRQHGGMEREIVQWFAAGANAYIDALEVEDLPFEFRLLGYEPDRYTEIQSARLLQYFAYDLTFRGDAARYQTVKERLSPEEYATLYPRNAPVVVPIIPEPGGGALGGARRAQQETLSEMKRHRAEGWSATKQTSSGWIASAEGFIPGKGSNNWVVSGARSTTGAPILAGDMHLSLTLPAIWYEVHLVTPTMNTYGVTAPGTPLPVEAFNEYVAWAFTNTGGDVLDTYALELDETGTRYRFEDGYRDLDMVLDTIEVKGREPVVDTLYYAHWGPVVFEEGGAKAIRWAAHEPSGTLRALWHMNHARNYEEFQVGLEQWDTPMQNIIYADVEGNIAIRSTGYMPIREAGHGVGVLDGSSRSFEWVGRVPFDDLPHSFNPAHGFLSSTNQQPADSTYPYYLGHDWRSVYRSLRIDSLLRSKPTHSVDDFKRYQADVHAVQRDLFV